MLSVMIAAWFVFLFLFLRVRTLFVEEFAYGEPSFFDLWFFPIWLAAVGTALSAIIACAFLFLFIPWVRGLGAER